LDVQGINKTAAESYYRIFSRKINFDAISVRLPGCFGQNQPVLGSDIGLIGSMIRDLISEKTIKVYGNGRMRNFIFGVDCARIICDIVEMPFSGFSAYNLGGIRISIEELARKLVKLVGRGAYEIQEIPDSIKLMDVGNAPMDESRLRKKLGKLEYTNIDEALLSAVNYFKKEVPL
jgi:UDP-glucose 4-epimerase